MNGALLKKNLHDGAFLFVGISIAVAAFAWFRVRIVGALDTGTFSQIIDLLPDDWQRLASVDFDWMVSYLGRTATTLDEPLLILLVSIWAVVRASDAVSGGLGRGTLEMILAQPVGRLRFFLIHQLVTVIGLVIISILIWAGMAFAVQTVEIKESVYPEIRIPIIDYHIPITFAKPEEVRLPMSDYVNAVDFWPGIFNLFCLGYFMMGMTALLSSMDRFRWRTLGISIGIYFASAMAKIGSMASDSFEFLKYFTYFSLYNAVPFIKLNHEDASSSMALFQWTEAGQFDGLGPAGCNLALLALGTIMVVAGARIFARRDLPAPV